MNENIGETRFENGLVVLTDRMSGVRSATLGFFYRVGSRNEPNELNGITHFIEHCVFKGTERRSALDIAIEQDRLGGNLDAFTTHEETGFVIKVIDDQIETAFDLLADMLTNPRFDEADLENEQRVIIEEMKMNEDSPEELLGDIFQREFFPDHPLGLDITGTPGTVQTFDSKKTLAYHEQNFTPENLVIAAAGNIEHEQLLGFVKGADRLCGSKIRDPQSAIRNPTAAAPISLTNRPDLEQVHFVMAVPMVGARDQRRYAADLLSNILGGGTSSRLWQSVREARGLAYGIASSVLMYRDCGLLSVSGSASPEHVEEISDLVVKEMRSIIRKGVTNDELQLQKDQARAAILLGLEDSASRAGSLAQCEITHGRQITVAETLENLERVTPDDVREIAAQHFRTEKIAFAALGDLEGVKFERDRLTV